MTSRGQESSQVPQPTHISSLITGGIDSLLSFHSTLPGHPVVCYREEWLGECTEALLCKGGFASIIIPLKLNHCLQRRASFILNREKYGPHLFPVLYPHRDLTEPPVVVGFWKVEAIMAQAETALLSEQGR